ncbi:hypothetical protein GQ53DRAFT_679815 [Thozetella sp. PMI_491]|nr:hypothetical protein GQ53DRAFT_679815 [Thozetella sp. PMI_491]
MRVSVATIFGLLARAGAQDLWCGKVYTAGVPEVLPEGWLYPPTASSAPLLDVQISPRHSIYVSSEPTGQFIVDAGLSYFRGLPYEGYPPDSDGLQARVAAPTKDTLKITIKINCKTVATGFVAANTTNNLFDIPFAGLTPRIDAYPVNLTVTAPDGTSYKASTSVFYLPEKTTGSVVKVDYLYGSLLYRNSFTNGAFAYVFPYGFYGNYDAYFQVSANIEAYRSRGFNALNPVTAFTDGNMTSQIDTMDAVNLLWQYDMRGSFMNLTSVAEQVPLVKDHPSLLTWYTADEPDGWEYDLNSTKLTYDLLAEMDKYHPVALVLNCQNYYFPEYTSGADIIMEDAYPVGINATWSYRGTPCNSTYGDCGCDNCKGSLLDVPERVDAFHAYQSWLGGGVNARKPVWEVPQSFSGEGYWSRDPTPQEVWVMDILSFNHGAKGRFSWIYPASDIINDAAAQMAKVVTVSPVMDFLTQANPVLVEDATKTGGVDVAYWKLDAGKLMVGVANPNNETLASFEVILPIDGCEVTGTLWGDVSWSTSGGKLVAEGGLPALGTSLVTLQALS